MTEKFRERDFKTSFLSTFPWLCLSTILNTARSFFSFSLIVIPFVNTVNSRSVMCPFFSVSILTNASLKCRGFPSTCIVGYFVKAIETSGSNTRAFKSSFFSKVPLLSESIRLKTCEIEDAKSSPGGNGGSIEVSGAAIIQTIRA